MSRVLIITVGGSCQPIVTAINRNRPDYVYFICSDDNSEGIGSYQTVTGEGMVCGPWGKLDKPNILTQCEIKEDSYGIVKIKEIDDYNHCYLAAHKLISKQYSTRVNPEIIVDYTGGTKSMSAGLLLAATEYPDIIVSVVRGERPDLIKVKDGTQRVKSTRTNTPLLNAQKKQILKLVELYDYSSALELVNDALNTPDLVEEYEADFLSIRDFCLCLNDWDNFNHIDALEILKKKECLPVELTQQLQNVVYSRKCLEEGRPIPPRQNFSRYEVVFDLLKNAKRKAIQRKYDDAVGRLYRTTELLAQAYLKIEHGVDTGKVVISQLPENTRDYYMDKYPNREVVELSLLESYQLAAKLSGDSLLSEIFENQKNRVMQGLKVRNFSILAHGFSPINEDKYREVYKILIEDFVSPILKHLVKDYHSTYFQLPNTHAPQPL